MMNSTLLKFCRLDDQKPLEEMCWVGIICFQSAVLNQFLAFKLAVPAFCNQCPFCVLAN